MGIDLTQAIAAKKEFSKLFNEAPGVAYIGVTLRIENDTEVEPCIVVGIDSEACTVGIPREFLTSNGVRVPVILELQEINSGFSAGGGTGS